MGRSFWQAVLTLTIVLAIAGGDAVAKKGGGGKPGGGGDPGNATPLDILFHVNDNACSGCTTLYGLQDDGTGTIALTSARGGAAWSPDGTQVAFYGLQDGFGIYLLDLAAGTTTKLLALENLTAGWLDWCPVPEAGMHKLAFTMRDASTGIDVYVVYFDDEGLVDTEQVTATSGDEQSLTWSPTGDQLAVDYYNEIRVLDLANRDSETDLPTTHTVYSSTQRSPNYPTWAKTGNRIAFTASDASDSYPLEDVYVLSVSQEATTGAWSGSTPVNLTNTPNDVENGTLSWSPDDSLIVCFSVYWRQLGKGSGKGSLQLIDSVTGSRSKLANGGVHPAWRRGTD